MWRRDESVVGLGLRRHRAEQREWVRDVLREARVPMAPSLVAAVVVVAAVVANARWAPLRHLLQSQTDSMWVTVLVPYAVQIVVLGLLTWRWGRHQSGSWLPTSGHALAGIVTVGLAIPLETIAVHAAGLGVPGGPSSENTVPFEVAPGPILVAVVIGAPIIEELAIRGWLLGALTHTRLGGLGAVVVSALVFGAAHVLTGTYGLIGFAATTMFGVAAAVAVLATGSLIPGIVAHAIGNLIAGLTGLGYATAAGQLFLVIVAVTILVVMTWSSRRRVAVAAAVAVETDERWAHVDATVGQLVDRYHLDPRPTVEVRRSLPKGKAALRTGLRQPTISVANDALQDRPLDHIDVAVAQVIDDIAHPSRRLQIYENLAIAGFAFAGAFLFVGLLYEGDYAGAGQRWLLLGLIPTVPAAVAAQAATASERRQREAATDKRVAELYGTDAVTDAITADAARRTAWQTFTQRALGPLASTNPTIDRINALHEDNGGTAVATSPAGASLAVTAARDNEGISPAQQKGPNDEP